MNAILIQKCRELQEKRTARRFLSFFVAVAVITQIAAEIDNENFTISENQAVWQKDSLSQKWQATFTFSESASSPLGQDTIYVAYTIGDGQPVLQAKGKILHDGVVLRLVWYDRRLETEYGYPIHQDILPLFQAVAAGSKASCKNLMRPGIMAAFPHSTFGSLWQKFLASF